VTKSSLEVRGLEKGFFDSTTTNSFIGSNQPYLNSYMESTTRGNFDVGELSVTKKLSSVQSTKVRRVRNN
jgi:hypothetical protein